jgi:hypothetical protein
MTHGVSLSTVHKAIRRAGLVNPVPRVKRPEIRKHQEIRRLAESGLTQTAIARRMGVTRQLVDQVLHKRLPDVRKPSPGDPFRVRLRLLRVAAGRTV